MSCSIIKPDPIGKCSNKQPNNMIKSIIYYPVTKLVFNSEHNFIGTGKLINEKQGLRVIMNLHKTP